MVDKFKSTDIVTLPKKEAAIVLSEAAGKDDVVKVTDVENTEVIALKKQLSDAEDREKSERAKRIEAEKSREEANTKVASSQNDAVRAHEAAITNAIEVATGNLAQIKRDLREAMEGGDMDRQVDLQEKLADARWQYKGAEQNKKQFDDWKEKQKNAVVAQPSSPKYTASEQAWIDAHPRFNTDDDYYEAVAGADSAARRRGIQPDTKAYYEYVEARLKKMGLEDDGSTSATNDNGRDTTGSQDDEDEVVIAPVKKVVKATVSAPATNSSPSSNSTSRNNRQFKLTPEMQDMAHRMFGPNSSHKLSEQQAETKYASYQMDIRDRRAAGEKI